ncbi:bolA-like protein 2 [Gorilla gorilla gorilla]|uniref:bolA-like protein 2 n=1 Tax=Gorilla gorilla gorilla TaxID=9595 RepID=UPI0024461B72|nr:bolA-like protein 2 [Gorilla gorilla gorilla]
MPASLPLCFDAIIKSKKAYVREVAPVRAQSSVAGVRAGVLSPLGCRPSWTTARELSANYLQEKLQRDLEAEHVEVEDTTFNRCACSFRVLVVSAKFEGKPLLQRHQLVNACLEELPHIHAFEQKTLTPEQWAREQQK